MATEDFALDDVTSRVNTFIQRRENASFGDILDELTVALNNAFGVCGFGVLRLLCFCC